MRLAADGDLADLRPTGGHRVVTRTVIDIERPTADMPERLEPVLAARELDVVDLRSLKEVSQSAAESARPSVHSALPNVVRGEPVVEDEDVLFRERDVHAAPPCLLSATETSPSRRPRGCPR